MKFYGAVSASQPSSRYYHQLTCYFSHKLQFSANTYGCEIVNPFWQLHGMQSVSRLPSFPIKKTLIHLKHVYVRKCSTFLHTGSPLYFSCGWPKFSQVWDNLFLVLQQGSMNISCKELVTVIMSEAILCDHYWSGSIFSEEALTQTWCISEDK